MFARWLERVVDLESGGCLFVAGAAEFGNVAGPLKEKISDLQGQWRKELAKAIELSTPKSASDSQQLAFELFSLILGVHHDARMFAAKDALRRGELAFERFVQTHFNSK